MLKGLVLENFKAFEGRRDIPLAPITLIFGGNSTGKSSILQSLVLVKQTLQSPPITGSLFQLRGEFVDLGTHRDVMFGHGSGLSGISIGLKYPMGILTGRRRESYDAGMMLSTVHDSGSNLGVIDSAAFYCSIDQQYSWDQPLVRFRPASGSRRSRGREHYLEPDPSIEITKESIRSGSILNTSPRGMKKVISSVMDTSLMRHKEMLGGRYTFDPGPRRRGEKVNFDFSTTYRSSSPNLDAEIGLMPVMGRVESLLYKNIESMSYLGPLRYQYMDRINALNEHAEMGNDKTGAAVPSLLFTDDDLVDDVNAGLGSLEIGYQLNIVKFPQEGLEHMFSVRLVETGSHLNHGILDVGFGVGQVLPVVVYSAAATNGIVTIEQPEIHLHPRLQAALGTFFAQKYKERNNQFIIETHSEHLLLRLQRLIREGFLKSEEVCVLCVHRQAGAAQIKQIHLDEDGDFMDRWPGGFFEEGFNEILGL